MRGKEEFEEIANAVRWYRGFSAAQVEACNKLWQELRDDIYQDTLYRVIRCLEKLGLYPMIRHRQLKRIVTISQGSDLAFLWFLWEAHYKLNSHFDDGTTYSYNEQLLLSAIAHLDMSTTLSGLDKVLPLPQHSTIAQKPSRRQTKQQQMPQQRPQQGQQRKQYAKPLPYFQPLRRPERYVAKPPYRNSVKHRLEETASDADGKRDVGKDDSRWFAKYQLSPIKAEVWRCLSTVMDRIFQDENERQPIDSMCQAHRMMEHTRLRQERELGEAALKRCMHLLDLDGVKNRLRSARTMRQLEREVALAAAKLAENRKQQKIVLQQLNVDRQNPCTGVCQMCVEMVTPPPPPHKTTVEAGGEQIPLLLPTGWNTLGHPLPGPPADDAVHVMQWGAETVHKTVTLVRKNKEEPDSCLGPQPKPKKRPARPVVELNVIGRGSSKATSALASSSSGSHCFRRVPKDGVPTWNFFRIFEPPPQVSEPDVSLCDVQPFVRSFCIAALHNAMATSEQKEAAKIYGKRYVQNLQWRQLSLGGFATDAATAFAKQLFAAEKKRLSEVRKQPGFEPRVEATHIDPENRHMLMDLVKKAFDLLRKDPKYVLVTLPNAHKLPNLLDWVAERYGKTFTRNEVELVVKSKNKVTSYIQQQAALAYMPELGPLSEILKQAFLENRPKSKFSWHLVKSAFYQMLSLRSIEESRLLWLALRQYSPLSAIRPSTFFAYMPSRQLDVLRNSPWMAYEFRPMEKYRRDFAEKFGACLRSSLHCPMYSR